MSISHRRPSYVGPMLVAVLLLWAAACSDQGTTGLSNGEPLPSTAESVVASCGPVVFSEMPPDPKEFPPLDANAQAGLDELVNGPTGVEAVEYAGDIAWSIAERTDEILVLLGQPQDTEEPTWLYAQFEPAAPWSPQSWGGCEILVESPGFGPASVATDPEQPVESGDTELKLLINERDCASGTAPVDREVVTLVTETAEAVTITVLVALVDGHAECPSNPWHPVAVTLNAPLGSRTLIDGSLFPTRPIGPATDLEN